MMSVIHSCELSPAYVYHFKKTRFAIIREMTERSKSIFTNKELEKACRLAFFLVREMRPYNVDAFKNANAAIDRMFCTYGRGLFYNT
jgi:hypothetical protein